MTLTPGAAILWTLLVPGSAHVRLGRPLRGVLAFLTSVGLFAAGVALVGDRIWYFQLFEPFSLLQPVLSHVPIQLLPESANLGPTIVLAQLRDMPPASEPQALWDWMRSIRIPVPHEHIGLFLTGCTGVINSIWAADAHWLAQERPHDARPAPALAAFVSWLLPGSGHAMVGQRDKGILMGAAVWIVFGLGLLVAHGHAVDRPQLSAWWIGQVLCGGGTLFATFVTAPWHAEAVPAWFETGVALCTVAGFMNLVVMIDAYTVAEQRVLRGVVP